MADAFDAYFGVGTGLGEDSQPMINALRGQKREGDFLGMSTIDQVANMGRGQTAAALDAGKRAGGLKLAREAEERKRQEAAAANTEKHALAMALQKQRAKDAKDLKQFDIDNRENKTDKIKYGKPEQYVDRETGAKHWVVQGDDGMTYRYSDVGDGSMSPMSIQGLDLPLENTKGSTAKPEKAVPMYPVSGGDAVMGFQREGKFFDVEGNPLGREYTTENTNEPLPEPKVKPEIRRLSLPNGEIIKVREGKDDGKLYDANTNQVVETTPDHNLLAPYKDYSTTALEKARKDVKLAAQTRATLDDFKIDYANDSGIPMFGTLQNMFSKHLPKQANDEINAQGEWWKKLRRFHDLLAKHELFGAALSKGEAQSWVDANINENASPEQAQAYVEMMKEAIDAEMLSRKDTDIGAGGYDPAKVDAVYKPYTDNVYGDALTGRVGVQPPQMTPEQQKRFDALPKEKQAYILQQLQGG